MSNPNMKELFYKSEFVIKHKSIITTPGNRLDNCKSIEKAQEFLKENKKYTCFTVIYENDRKTINYIWINTSKFIDTTFHDKNGTDEFLIKVLYDYNYADSYMFIDETLYSIIKLNDYKLPIGFDYSDEKGNVNK